MSDTELRELREWAAKVCGHERKLDGLGDGAEAFIIEVEGGELDYWLPDQNIAQAFEVLDAMRLEPQMILLKRGINRWWVTVSRYFENGPEEMAQHENRCMAILLACRKAAEKVK